MSVRGLLGLFLVLRLGYAILSGAELLILVGPQRLCHELVHLLGEV